jgi:hypothetical protein
MVRPSRRRTRRLSCENLERRQLLASDFHIGHNFRMPEDADGNGLVSPIDALRVINNLNLRVTQTAETVDVTADGVLSPLDALVVINYLNINRPSGNGVTAPSNVSAAARIARIQAAIETNTLPTGVALSDAKEMLSTLEAGAAPELNECAADGLIADSAMESNGTTTNTLDRRLTMLSERLLALGVNQETVDTLVDNIRTTIEEGATRLREVIQTEMENLGIDIRQLLETARANRQLEFIEHRLTELDVEQATIDQVVAFMQAGIDAGDPVTKSELEAKLTELGIDPADVFARRHIEPIDFLNQPVDVDKVTQHLTARGVNQSIIDTIVTEINEKAEAGDPMTRRELIARLVELSVIGQADAPPVRRILEQIRRRFR